MNILRRWIRIGVLMLICSACTSNPSSDQQSSAESEVDSTISPSPQPPPINPKVIGIWQFVNSEIDGQKIQFEAETSGLKTWTFNEDGTFSEHQVIEDEMVIGNGSFSATDKELTTSIITDEDPLEITYSIELLTEDSLVLKGAEETAAFTFYYIRAE